MFENVRFYVNLYVIIYTYMLIYIESITISNPNMTVLQIQKDYH